MRTGCIKIGMIICVVSLIIYLVKNFENFKVFLEKVLNIHIVKNTICIVSIMLVIGTSILLIKSIGASVNSYSITNEYEDNFKIDDEKMQKENIYYRNTMNKTYEKQTYDNPYIPEGFSYVEGNYKTGYVIQDENKNQYVWVPCTNKDIEDIPKLERRNFVSTAFIAYNTCYNNEYEEFLKSALENGGFYVSRFEIGKENDKPVSKKDIEVWRNVTRSEAENIINTMYEDNSIKCKLINGYAYDTTLEWINNTNDVEGNFVELEMGFDFEPKEKLYTGRNQYNNVFDFCDNILELTDETSYGTVIIRGFSNSKDAEYEGTLFSKHSRYSILAEEKTYGYVDTIGFRTILYK